MSIPCSPRFAYNLNVGVSRQTFVAARGRLYPHLTGPLLERLFLATTIVKKVSSPAITIVKRVLYFNRGLKSVLLQK